VYWTRPLQADTGWAEASPSSCSYLQQPFTVQYSTVHLYLPQVTLYKFQHSGPSLSARTGLFTQPVSTCISLAWYMTLLLYLLLLSLSFPAIDPQGLSPFLYSLPISMPSLCHSLHPEDGSSMALQNANILHHYMMS